MGAGARLSRRSISLPPVPGPLEAADLLTTVLRRLAPKEGDLRSLPTLASETLGLGSPVALATGPETSAPYGIFSGPPAFDSVLATPFDGRGISTPLANRSEDAPEAPYFLALAGLPAPAPAAPVLATPSSPGKLPSAPESNLLAPEAKPLAPESNPLASGSLPGATREAAEAPATEGTAVPTYDFHPELTPDVASTSRQFEPNTIKKDFPILRERVHGRPLVWLDNAATTQKPQAVIDRISYFYEHENSNIHRAAHTLAARASDAYEAARDKVRRYLNAPSKNEIVFVRGTTEAINLVSQSWGSRNISPGD